MADKKFKSDTPTMEEIRRLKKPNTRKVAILLDSALSHQMDDVASEIERLKRTKSMRSGLDNPTQKQIDELEEKLIELEEEAAGLTVEFTFQDLGRKRYDALVTDNPATDEDQEAWKRMGGEGKLAYNLESFPPALISACAISPKISLEEAKAIFDEWSEGDLEMLFTTALLACKEPTSLPKSRAASVRMQDSQQNSTTALNGESPTPNS